MEHLKQNTGRFEWYTPQPIVDSVSAVLGGIGLDPASHEMAQKNIQAMSYFTEEDDGLQRRWYGTVFLNPPYARRIINLWINKLINEYEAQRTTEYIALVNNATDTAWAQKLMAHSTVICMLRGRVKFIDANGSNKKSGALQGQMLCYKGSDTKFFIQEFQEKGVCFERT